MADGRCMVCGRIIPEENHVCLHCMAMFLLDKLNRECGK